tara:strand:+ start:7197 stop:7661 length:465 start_codon:yes stop_codon:yes gene_type:complete
MLAEMAAFNAAFAVVKQTVQNSGDLVKCAKQIGEIVGVKADLQDKVNRKKTGFLANLSGKTANEFEEFQALEEVREAEEHLKTLMIWTGRPGLWADWQRFQAEARKQRIKEREELEKRRQQMLKYFGYFIGATTFVVGFIFLIIWIRYLQGTLQ